MAYNMRPLKTTDVFRMSKILKKLDVKTNEIEITKEMTEIQVGISIILKGLENLYLAEKEVSDFLADLVGITTEQFSELPIEDTLQIITLFKDQKGIASFLKSAGKLTK